MSSKPRIIVPDVFYEVTARGARGSKIFESDELKSFFLKELSRSLKKFNFQCFGWSLLDDHYHLILKSSDIPISKFMQRLNSVYAKHYNRIKKEQGTVFYRRFASIIVQEETGFKELIRYVHLNPVRCGACTLDELAAYEWCGHRALLNRESDQIQNTCNILVHFSGPDTSNAYREFIHFSESEQKNEKIIHDIRNANLGMEKFSQPEPWILGNTKFVQLTLERDSCNRAQAARHIREDVTCENIHNKIRITLNLSDADFYRQGRLNHRTLARLLFAYIGYTRFDFSGMELARYLGVTGSAISRMLSRWNDVKNKEDVFDRVMNGKRVNLSGILISTPVKIDVK